MRHCLKLTALAYMCQLEPELQEHIDNPVGTALIRVCSNRLEVDNQNKEIYFEKRK